jgi:hypothetical protein
MHQINVYNILKEEKMRAGDNLVMAAYQIAAGFGASAGASAGANDGANGGADAGANAGADAWASVEMNDKSRTGSDDDAGAWTPANAGADVVSEAKVDLDDNDADEAEAEKAVEEVPKKAASEKNAVEEAAFEKAAVEEAVDTAASGYAHVVERTRAFYDQMKTRNRFQTGQDDYMFSALLGLSNLEPEAGAERIDQLYNNFIKEFRRKNSVHMLAQILTLCGASDDDACRVLELRDALAARKLRFNQSYVLPLLGVFAMLRADADEIADDLAEACEYLRSQKGFGIWSVTVQELYMLASAIVASEYAGAEYASAKNAGSKNTVSENTRAETSGADARGAAATAALSVAIIDMLITMQTILIVAITASTTIAATRSS